MTFQFRPAHVISQRRLDCRSRQPLPRPSWNHLCCRYFQSVGASRVCRQSDVWPIDRQSCPAWYWNGFEGSNCPRVLRRGCTTRRAWWIGHVLASMDGFRHFPWNLRQSGVCELWSHRVETAAWLCIRSCDPLGPRHLVLPRIAQMAAQKGTCEQGLPITFEVKKLSSPGCP